MTASDRHDRRESLDPTATEYYEYMIPTTDLQLVRLVMGTEKKLGFLAACEIACQARKALFHRVKSGHYEYEKKKALAALLVNSGIDMDVDTFLVCIEEQMFAYLLQEVEK